MDFTQYLQRINYSGLTATNAETLRRLQLAHLEAVPFENLSIHANEPIVLNDEALFEKIVVRGRGGFCYELNGLFASLLRSLGFNVVKLSARVANESGDFGPEFDHMTLLVTAPATPQERWLADVGFGDSFNKPLLLDDRNEQHQGRRSYRIDFAEDHFVLLQRETDNDWKPQYRFTLEPHEYAEYSGMCQYHQTSPQSHFTRAPVCTRITAAGRITLSGMRLISSRLGVRVEREIVDADDFKKVLRDQFGIELNSPLMLSRIQSQR